MKKFLFCVAVSMAEQGLHVFAFAAERHHGAVALVGASLVMMSVGVALVAHGL
ncbi:MAG TPA: hypothetical protein VFA48_06110 [Gammaproteobacteria bacterium]|nr:hypothetical protein [Gammaproteobacteria bacterium]